MKIKEGFRLRTVGDSNIIVPTGKAVLSFNGMITLNGTGKAVWECIEAGKTAEETAKHLTSIYSIGYEQALKDVNELCDKMVKAGIAEK